jgi:hypothetical protein
VVSGPAAGHDEGMDTPAAAASRLLLVSRRRDTVAAPDANAAKVRRYRLARRALAARPPGISQAVRRPPL